MTAPTIVLILTSVKDAVALVDGYGQLAAADLPE
jgi:hypothetical protein